MALDFSRHFQFHRSPIPFRFPERPDARRSGAIRLAQALVTFDQAASESELRTRMSTQAESGCSAFCSRFGHSFGGLSGEEKQLPHQSRSSGSTMSVASLRGAVFGLKHVTDVSPDDAGVANQNVLGIDHRVSAALHSRPDFIENLCRRFAHGKRVVCHLNYAQIHFASVAAFVAGWRSS